MKVCQKTAASLSAMHEHGDAYDVKVLDCLTAFKSINPQQLANVLEARAHLGRKLWVENANAKGQKLTNRTHTYDKRPVMLTYLLQKGVVQCENENELNQAFACIEAE